eukprot:234044-Prymnesium_polylepis.1
MAPTRTPPTTPRPATAHPPFTRSTPPTVHTLDPTHTARSILPSRRGVTPSGCRRAAAGRRAAAAAADRWRFAVAAGDTRGVQDV